MTYLLTACYPTWGVSHWQGLSRCLHLGFSILTGSRYSSCSWCLQRGPSVRCFSSCGLFCLRWGFQVKACLVMFTAGLWSMWPIHLNHLPKTSSSTVNWFGLFQRLLLLMVMGQRIWRIILMQVLMKACTFFMVVIFILYVSDPGQTWHCCWKAWAWFGETVPWSSRCSSAAGKLFLLWQSMISHLHLFHPTCQWCCQSRWRYPLLQCISLKADWVCADCVGFHDLGLHWCGGLLVLRW